MLSLNYESCPQGAHGLVNNLGREGVNIGYKLLKHRGGVLNSYPGSLETPSVLNCTKQSGLWSAVVREGEEVGAFPPVAWPQVSPQDSG